MYVVSSSCSFVFVQVLDLGAAPVHPSHLNDHTDVTTATNALTGRGFQDEVSCFRGNYDPSLLPWRICHSRARFNAGCGDLPSSQGCKLVLPDDTTQQDSLVFVTPSAVMQILSYFIRQLCVISASTLGFTVFLSVPTEAQGDKMENAVESSPNLENQMGVGMRKCSSTEWPFLLT